MREHKTENISIRVHPAVRRYFDNHFQQSGDAYDLRGHFLHDFLRAGLTKEAQPETDCSLPEIKVAFSRRDWKCLGHSVTERHQAAFSRLAYKFIQQTACQEVLYAHVAGGIPRDTAIKEFLLYNLFEDDELNYAALRKYYQRNWMEAERRALEEYADLAARRQPAHCTIILPKNVPTHQ